MFILLHRGLDRFTISNADTTDLHSEIRQCVCVCVSERASDREREKECVGVCVCVCV
jgi:hypothetical protein